MNKLSNRDINRYLKGIKKQLLLTHSSKEASAILEMIQTSIFEFIEDRDYGEKSVNKILL